MQALLPLKSLQSLEIASPYVTKDGVAAFTKQLPSLQTINHYRYRLDNSDISVSPNDRFFRRGWQAERGPQEALEGHAPPPLTVDRWQNIDGDSLSLDDLKGKVVLVYFWREPISWCRMQMPAVNALYEKYHDQGLEIIGVHSTEDADNLQFYADKHNIHWPRLRRRRFPNKRRLARPAKQRPLPPRPQRHPPLRRPLPGPPRRSSQIVVG
ncbi:MAG: TlpA disulfide reductase family protein [Planctomycetaceae bacterium]